MQALARITAAHDTVRILFMSFAGHVFIRITNTSSATVDHFLIEPTHRGTGLGSAFLNRVLQRYKDYTIFLISSPGREALYTRLGFHKTGHQTVTLCSAVSKVPPTQSQSPGIKITLAKTEDLMAVIAYVEDITSFKTDALFQAKFKPNNNTIVFIAYRVQLPDSKSPQKVAGCLFVTDTIEFDYRVSAWYCDNQDIAKLLIEAIVREIKDTHKPFRISFHRENTDRVLYATQDVLDAKDHQLHEPEEIFSSTGCSPDVQWDKVFGICEASKFSIV